MQDSDRKHQGTLPMWLSFLLNNPIRRHFDKNPEMVIKVLGICNTSVVLDFGCGPGFYTVPFAKIANRVLAVDLQQEMLKKAAKYAEKNGVLGKVQFFQTGGNEIPQAQGGQCDFVFLSFVYHEIDETDKEQVLLELRRILKPGGKLAMIEHTKRPLIGPHSVNLAKVKEELAVADFSGTEVVEVTKNVGLIIATKEADDCKDLEGKVDSISGVAQW